LTWKLIDNKIKKAGGADRLRNSAPI